MTGGATNNTSPDPNRKEPLIHKKFRRYKNVRRFTPKRVPITRKPGSFYISDAALDAILKALMPAPAAPSTNDEVKQK